MNPSTLIPLSIFILVGGATATTFTVQNNCPYTIWAAAIPVGGGQRLDNGQTWTFDAPASTSGRIWGRTKCSDAGTGCETGDCGALQCQLSGQTPVTLAEYTTNGGNNKDTDFIDISLVDGFNLPMEFSSNSGGCSTDIKCAADINSQCPAALQVPGGCKNGDGQASFFKGLCPDAYSFPGDDQTSTFTCPTGTNYKVVFCP